MFEEIEREKKDLPEIDHMTKMVKPHEWNFYQIVAVFILAIGFIAGIFAGNLFPACSGGANIFSICQETEFNLALMLITWGSTFLLAMFFYGMGTIIKLLESLVKNTK